MLAVGQLVLGDVSDQEIKMSSGFAAGIGSTKQELCGALSAGVMIIGGLTGRISAAVDDTLCQELVQEYRERFINHFEHLNCGKLREVKFGAQGLKPCSALVERAAELLLQVVAGYYAVEQDS